MEVKDANSLLSALTVTRHILPRERSDLRSKRVNVAIKRDFREDSEGRPEGGTTISLGASEDAVGIVEDHHLMGEDTYKAKLLAFSTRSSSWSVVPPTSKDDLDNVKPLS